MEHVEDSSGETPGRWRNMVEIDETRGVWMVEEPAESRQVWLIRLNAGQRADETLLRELAERIERLRERHEPQLGVPVTGTDELRGAGEIGFAVPPGQLWGDVFPLGTKTRWGVVKPWALSFCRVLETAEKHGLVDGSLHPSRVWLSEDGRLLVPGFGLGPLLDPAKHPDLRQVWFSPQAVDGFAVTALDDRYSVGAMIYQAATGAVPLDIANPLYAIRYAKPAPIADSGARIPARAAAAITDCLEKEPPRRPASLAGLRSALDVLEEPAPQKGKPFMPVEFDATLKEAAPLPPPPGIEPYRPAFLRLEVWFSAFVILAAAGFAGWMIWFSWPKAEDPNSDEALAAKAKELSAQFERDTAAVNATNPPIDLASLTNLDLSVTATNAVPAEEPKSTLDPKRAAELRAAAEREADEILNRARREAEEQARQREESANQARRAAQAAEEARFVSLFNGKDLSGWTGDEGYWSVQNGTLTGWIGVDAAPGTVARLNSAQPPVGDFELRGQFRLRLLRDNKAGSAAIVYRAGETGREGYRFLLGFDPETLGGIAGEGARGTLAAQGERTELSATAGNPAKIVNLGQSLAARSSLRMNDWNEFKIIAQGDTVTHELNGIVVAVLRDPTRTRPKSGAIGLRVGGAQPACVVQFKDLKLRRN